MMSGDCMCRWAKTGSAPYHLCCIAYSVAVWSQCQTSSVAYTENEKWLFWLQAYAWQPLPRQGVVLQITYSSDHFEQLYQLSIQLIKGSHAYVDHQTADQIKLSRSDTLDSSRKGLKEHLAYMPFCS